MKDQKLMLNTYTAYIKIKSLRNVRSMNDNESLKFFIHKALISRFIFQAKWRNISELSLEI